MIDVNKRVKSFDLFNHIKPSGSNALWVFCIVVLMFCIKQDVNSQDRIELGGFLGTSYYFGDLNPDKQFYNSNLAIGGIARYAYSDRLAFKATATLGTITGDYTDEDLNFFDVHPQGQQASRPNYYFKNTIGDLAVQVEFNFLSYDHEFISTTNFTPYISMGLGTMFYKRKELVNENFTSKPTFILSLPFGVGVKYKVNQWMRVGAEWSFRKTFVDDLDVVANNTLDPSDPYDLGNTWTHNNDWVSFAGVHVTISMLKRKTSCSGGY